MQTKLIVRKLCRDILCLAMQISEETETDVYVKYFHYVNEFEVRIYLKGFEKDYDNYTSYEIDLTGENAEEKLREIKENLQSIWRCKDVSSM